ncbi:MAG: ATP-binding cassette domain-containing protein [Micrococcales bacterium]|nr:ATP-binding cassette domain-containing protein [Micrococcales bacterium]
MSDSALALTRGLTWTPGGRRRPTLAGIDLAISPGERVLLVGPSGSGKSTLLRALAGVLQVSGDGELAGEVLIEGRPATDGGTSVGLLLQDPRDARVAETVGRDAAFGCENDAMPRELIGDAVSAALLDVGFPYGPQHRTDTLSGGEAQRLALAGVIAARPRLLLLDEPTSMLDPIAAERVRRAVLGVLDEQMALVVVEHRLDGWVDVLPRIVVLDGAGRVIADGDTGRVLAEHAAELAGQGIWVPGRPAPIPVQVPPALLTSLFPTGGGAPAVRARSGLVRAHDVRLRHRRPIRFTGARRPADPPALALDGVDANVSAGRVLALRGASGAGKSSLVAVLTGLLAPTTGTVEADQGLAAGLIPAPHRWRSRDLAARIAWVPQDAAASIVGRTVGECLLATAHALGGPGGDVAAQRRAGDLAEILGLQRLLKRNPYRLSGGESRRLAIAAGLLHGPPVMCLDEPTVGQDRGTWAAVAGIIQGARAAGAGVVVSTHDDLLTRLADDELRLHRGRVGCAA